MPTGKQLVNLLKGIAYKQNKAVETVANEIVEYEKGKGHTELADQVMMLCNQIIGKSQPQLRSLPVDQDSRRNLVELMPCDISLENVIISMQNRDKLERFFTEYSNRDLLIPYDIRPMRKLLFCGYTGCGKTTLAKAVTAKLGYEMLYVNLSAVITSYLGKTSTNIHSTFQTAGQQPCVLFLDEFDALARDRMGEGQEVQEMKRVVNTLLQILDNFDNETVVIAATNLECTIDKAIFRRFDEVFYFEKPNKDEIKNTIHLKMHEYPFDLEILSLLDKLDGFTYADIEQICQLCLKHCIINKIDTVSKEIFEYAVKNQRTRVMDAAV